MQKINNQLAKKFSKYGYHVIKNINNFELIKNLEKKIISKLDKPSIIKTPKIIKDFLYTKKELRGPLSQLKYNLSKKLIKKGIKFINIKQML